MDKDLFLNRKSVFTIILLSTTIFEIIYGYINDGVRGIYEGMGYYLSMFIGAYIFIGIILFSIFISIFNFINPQNDLVIKQYARINISLISLILIQICF